MPTTRPCCAVVLVAGLAVVPGALAQNEWLAVTRVDRAQALGLTGAGVRIGMVEAELAKTSHVAFTGVDARLRPNAPASESQNHATHVASIMLARPNAAGPGFKGVATGASLASAFNHGDSVNDSVNDYNAAFTYLAAQNARVINMSAGIDPASSYPRTNPDGTPMPDPYTAAQRARLTRYADRFVASTGRTLVVAAANTPHNTGSPDDAYNVITVGGTGSTPDGRDYLVRNMRSASEVLGSQTRVKPDLVAPSTRIYSASANDLNNDTRANDYGDRTFPNNTWVSGNSFSAPMVSGTVALLMQNADNRQWSSDSRLMKSILMNSADKRVRYTTPQGNERRMLDIDQGHPDASTRRLDPLLGAGQLDALRAVQQQNAGNHNATITPGGQAGGVVPTSGWNLGSAAATNATPGIDNATTYITQRVRKGSYITSTLAWNRTVTTAANPDNWAYDPLSNLQLAVSHYDTQNQRIIENTTGRSDSPDDSVEHLYKKINESRQLALRVWNQSPSQAATPFAITWDATPSPTTHREFNGGFSAADHRYNDNGWYGGFVIVPFFQERTASRDDDSVYALALRAGENRPDSGKQEILVPSRSFTISFDYAWENNFGDLQVLINGVNLFDFDNVEGDRLRSAENLEHRFRRHTMTITDPRFFTAIGNAGTIGEIEFRTTIQLWAYVDNVQYIPAPGTACLALISLGLVTAHRRR